MTIRTPKPIVETDRTYRSSRFERQMWVNNPLDGLQRASLSTRIIVKYQQRQSYRERVKGYHGVAKRGEMYQIGVSFALENEGVYSEPLPAALGNRVYQVRMALAQYQAFPLVMGWGIEWLLPTGWAFADALGPITYEEFVSNPMVVTRMVRSPANPQPAGFQMVVVAKYP